jgi:hypothetical protein
MPESTFDEILDAWAGARSGGDSPEALAWMDIHPRIFGLLADGQPVRLLYHLMIAAPSPLSVCPFTPYQTADRRVGSQHAEALQVVCDAAISQPAFIQFQNRCKKRRRNGSRPTRPSPGAA